MNTKGFATVEYLVVVSALLLAILTPVSDGKNTVELLVDAFKNLYAGWAYVMSAAVFG
jgi:hypothetical protein